MIYLRGQFFNFACIQMSDWEEKVKDLLTNIATLCFFSPFCVCSFLRVLFRFRNMWRQFQFFFKAPVCWAIKVPVIAICGSCIQSDGLGWWNFFYKPKGWKYINFSCRRQLAAFYRSKSTTQSTDDILTQKLTQPIAIFISWISLSPRMSSILRIRHIKESPIRFHNPFFTSFTSL